MKKLDKKDKFNLFWIIIIYLGIALTITHGEYIFGSKIDWGFQHFAFPQYFRMLFYKTGDLFPDFAMNIGGGQNIYYFVYYGLLSPIILISYLLPFVSMSFYLAFISLVLGIVSIILFYIWIKGFHFDKTLCLVLTLLFAMASPLLFQSHRHVMFVDYMPFLILGLIGVRKYFSSGSKWLMMISIFLMIMTSYFYSVGGVICLTIYGVYEYLRKTDKFNFKAFFHEGCKFALYIVISFMMAGIILLPTIYALKNGRVDSLSHISLLKAIIPSLHLDFLLYKSYSIGLTGISLFAIVYLIFKKKEDRFLGICLTLFIIFPLFVYLLNGALYLDGKALIPFLPLYVMAIGLFLKDVNKLNYKIIVIIFILSVLWSYLEGNDFKFYFLFDGGLFLCSLFLYSKFKRKDIIYIPLIILSVCVCMCANLSDELILGEDFGKQNSLVLNEIISDISKYDKGFYRMSINVIGTNQTVNYVAGINENLTSIYSSTYNTVYNKFYYDFNNNVSARNMFITGEVKNTLFESLMGVKYLITDKAAPLGYKFVKRYGDYKVYVNKNTLPIGYSSSRVISYEDYDKLKFPDEDMALIGNVVSKSGNYKYKSPFSKINFDLASGEAEGIKISKYKDGYKVVVKGDSGSLKVRMDESVRNKFYLLRLNMENPQKCSLGDTYISVNNISNKLTCKEWKYFNGNYTFDYTLSSTKKFRYLYINFSKGTHYIKSYELYSLNYDDLVSFVDDISEFKVSKALGDKISGTIDVKKDGYFNLSIPYDKGFIIKVDGKKVDYEKVNKAFIGFPVKKGKHKIDIEFKAPNAFAGKIVSIFGIILFIVVNKKVYHK